MWFHCVRHLVLEVQVMFCSTETNEVRFLGSGCVGAAEPIEFKEEVAIASNRNDNDTTALY